jgi:hypothetical protein
MVPVVRTLSAALLAWLRAADASRSRSTPGVAITFRQLRVRASRPAGERQVPEWKPDAVHAT